MPEAFLLVYGSLVAAPTLLLAVLLWSAAEQFGKTPR